MRAINKADATALATVTTMGFGGVGKARRAQYYTDYTDSRALRKNNE
ncbi:MAG: hypothetical protein J5732_03090 [Bacteroidaceae bacterium]|nr:hypothetical protein [Bacteroidaceae bacterium]